MDKYKEILEFLKRFEQNQKRFHECLNRLETKIDEHTLILKTLEHYSEVNKA